MPVNVYPVTLQGVDFETTETTAKFPVLSGCLDSWGGHWKYVQANGAITIYAVVKVDNDGQATALTTAISGVEPTQVGIAQVAFADNDYGWVFVGPGAGTGSGIKVNNLVACAADVKLYTATAGNVDDTATDLIAGLTLVTANVSGGTTSTECFAATTLATNCQD